MGQTGLSLAELRASYRRLRERRVLVVGDDGVSIRMAPPFSGVPTQHVVESGGISWHANCAWDAFGIPAALHRPATVRSRCEATGAPLVLRLDGTPPPASPWVFHCQVPAAHWWEDIEFT